MPRVRDRFGEGPARPAQEFRARAAVGDEGGNADLRRAPARHGAIAEERKVVRDGGRDALGTPLAAASTARAAPEEMPYTYAEPPAASISASRSSTSRAAAYGAVSPLSPRPRRSYVKTVKSAARRSASGRIGPKAR